jgi:DNA-binding NtrC family response regulator
MKKNNWPANTILVLDEDRRVYKNIMKLFRTDMRLLFAQQPDEAAMILEDQPVGVLLCNETLQDHNGLSFMAQATRRFPHIQPVLMSGGSNDELMAIAINEVGVIKYLKKPINRSQLKKTLLSALSHHRESIEIARLKENYRNAMNKMHGVPYSVRRTRKAIRVILHNATDLTAVACSTIAVLMGFSFILGVFLLLLLYIFKMLFGIDLLSTEHLSSLLVQS